MKWISLIFTAHQYCLEGLTLPNCIELCKLGEEWLNTPLDKRFWISYLETTPKRTTHTHQRSCPQICQFKCHKKLKLPQECVRIITLWLNEGIPGHIHKASAVVVVVAQAVWVCIPHTAVLVLVGNWDTEVQDHSGKGLENVNMEMKRRKRLLK